MLPVGVTIKPNYGMYNFDSCRVAAAVAAAVVEFVLRSPLTDTHERGIATIFNNITYESRRVDSFFLAIRKRKIDTRRARE